MTLPPPLLLCPDLRCSSRLHPALTAPASTLPPLSHCRGVASLGLPCPTRKAEELHRVTGGTRFAERLVLLLDDEMEVYKKISDNYINVEKKFRAWSDAYASHCGNQAKENIINPVQLRSRDILQEIVANLGMKSVSCSHYLLYSDLYKGECKINLSNLDAYRGCGETKVSGDTKRNASDATGSAAEKTITRLEEILETNIVEYNYKSFVEVKRIYEELKVFHNNFLQVVSGLHIGWSEMIKKLALIVETAQLMGKVRY